MNAVNLIPLERRRGGAVAAPGTPFLGLVAALVLVLAATYLYVDLHDRVDARRTRLAQVQTGVSRWSEASARYSQDVTLAAQRLKGIKNIRALVADRYDWSLLLGELAKVTPAQVQLSSLAAAAQSPSSRSASSQSASSPLASTGSTASASGIQLSGCASSQTSVAATMVALRRVIGIAQVSLLQSQFQGASGACHFPVQFQLSIVFDPPLGQPTAGHASLRTGSEAADTASTSNGGAS